MSLWLSWFFFACVLISLVSTLVFSFRYRLQKEPLSRGLNAARMNISMGILLVALAMIQMLLFEESRVRTIVAALFILIGLYNLFAGVRNHAFYTRRIGK
ncbi:YtpI family protein [Gorillibacterium massiliense]|uniref:YtpI family protein n=1 Tax=Gorillibacterium massiliense TaxID=1280390 RepID=UPI0004BA64F6|nr:YtpI family protein [Gorillibacterium massiliense]